jgi:hypothetical protein
VNLDSLVSSALNGSRFDLGSIKSITKRDTYLSHPVEWVQGKLGEFVWSVQQRIMKSVRDNRRTACYSCHRIGKSHSAARIAFWWLDTHKAGEALVVTSAHSNVQVKMALWREMSRVHEKGKFPGRMNQQEYYIPIGLDGREEMVAFGRKPQDGDTTAFQGTYSKYILFVMDESCYVPQTLWDGAETLISNEHSRILAIGNPDDPNTEFARICSPGSGWNAIQVGYQDTPNFTGEDVPTDLKDMLIGSTWVEEKRKKWGEGSMLFVSKVLGQFPISSSEGLIPIQWVKAAQERTLIPTHPIELGVDVGGGHDKNVIAYRRGSVVRITKKDANPDTMQTLSNTLDMLEVTGAEKAKVDSIGIGKGAVDRAAEMSKDQAVKRDSPDLYRRAGLVVGIDVREKAEDSEHYVNRRAELYWMVRDRFESGDIDIDPEDDELANQLVNLRMKRSAGRVQIEEKDEMKRRLNGKSPDELESLMLSLAQEKKKIVYEVSW